MAARYPDGLITFVLILLGLVLMATPLALWVAWSQTVLLVVLASGVTAAVLYCVLVRFEKPDLPDRRAPSDRHRAETLPDKMIDELQRLHPFIYHNGPFGGTKFHAVMSRLKRHLYRRPE